MGTTGYTPQEAALVVTDKGFPFSAKQLRRALRKGQLTANQVSGRWYISRKNLNTFIRSKGKAAAAAVKAEEAEVKAAVAVLAANTAVKADEGVSMR